MRSSFYNCKNLNSKWIYHILEKTFCVDCHVYTYYLSRRHIFFNFKSFSSKTFHFSIRGEWKWMMNSRTLITSFITIELKTFSHLEIWQMRIKLRWDQKYWKSLLKILLIDSKDDLQLFYLYILHHFAVLFQH